jgi:hypothetical protein
LVRTHANKYYEEVRQSEIAVANLFWTGHGVSLYSEFPEVSLSTEGHQMWRHGLELISRSSIAMRSSGTLVALGILSGFLSYLMEGCLVLPISAQSYVSEIGINLFPLMPGICFGLVMAFAVWRPRESLVVFVGTSVAWQAASQAGLSTFQAMEALTDHEPTKLLVAGFIAGAVGSVITVTGLMLTRTFPKNGLPLIVVVFVGAIFGILLRWSMTSEGAGPLLYLTWQPAVAGIIGNFLKSNKSN